MKPKFKLIPFGLAIGIGLIASVVLYACLQTPDANSVDTEEPKRRSETFYVGDLICQFGDPNKACMHVTIYAYGYVYYLTPDDVTIND